MCVVDRLGPNLPVKPTSSHPSLAPMPPPMPSLYLSYPTYHLLSSMKSYFFFQDHSMSQLIEESLWLFLKCSSQFSEK